MTMEISRVKKLDNNRVQISEKGKLLESLSYTQSYSVPANKADLFISKYKKIDKSADKAAVPLQIAGLITGGFAGYKIAKKAGAFVKGISITGFAIIGSLLFAAGNSLFFYTRRKALLKENDVKEMKSVNYSSAVKKK